MKSKKKSPRKKKNGLPLSARDGIRQLREDRLSRAHTARWQPQQPPTMEQLQQRLATLDHWHECIQTSITQATAKAATQSALAILARARLVANEIASLPGIELEVCQYAVIAHASLLYLLNRLQRAIQDAAKDKTPVRKAGGRKR